MPDGAREWVVEPPGSGEISLFLAAGDGAVLTDEQRAALGALLRTLESSDAEVAGHGMSGCPKEATWCSSLSCGKMSCKELNCIQLKQGVAAAGTSWSLSGNFGVTTV
jgi:hypothetical protein